MLAKRFRLQIQDWFNEWQRTNRKAQIRRSGFFITRFSNNNLAYSRFGVIVSKKVFKSAVKRNRIKRIIFDFIRLNKLNEIKNRDVLITILPAASKLPKEEIKKELFKIL